MGAGSVAPVDPFLQMRSLGTDAGRITVAGVDHRLGRKRQEPVPDRIDDGREVAVGPSRGAGATGEQGVPGEDGARPGAWKLTDPGECPGVCRAMSSVPPTSKRCPSAISASGVVPGYTASQSI